MKRWGLLLVGLGVLGCDHAPPTVETCVTTDAIGERLRAAALYFEAGQLREVAVDVPFVDGRACMTLRPPTDRTPPRSDWRIYMESVSFTAQESVPSFAAWPIDIAVYDDLDANARIDPGELLGRSTALGSEAVTWFIEFKAYIKAWMLFDPARDEVVAARPFVLTSLSPQWGEDRVAHISAVPPEYALTPIVDLCDDVLYPSCLPTYDSDALDRERLYDARLTPEQLEALGARDPAPLRPVEGVADCTVIGEALVAQYIKVEHRAEVERCACVELYIPITVYTLADDPPEWLTCEGGDGGPVVIGK